MRKYGHVIGCSYLATLFTPVQAQTNEVIQKHYVQPTDIYRIVSISNLQFSPDGKTIAVVESRADLADDEYLTEIFLLDVVKGTHRPFTVNRRKAAQPRWSPDGKNLAFLAPDTEKKLQVFISPLDGGDARRVTHNASSIQQFTWSPDGKSIAYAATDAAPEPKGPDKFHTGFYVGHDDFTVREKPRPTHLWLVDLESGVERKLTSGDWSLPTNLPPAPPSSALKYTPDGKSILFVRQSLPATGDRASTKLEKLELATGKITALSPETSEVGYPLPSGDGRNVVFWRGGPGSATRANEVWLANGATTSSLKLSMHLDRSVFGTWWLPGNNSLLVSGNDGLRVGLWKLDLTGTAKRIPTGSVMPANSFWVEGDVSSKGSFAFVGQSPSSPGEVYVMDSLKAAPRRLTSVNDWTSSLALGRMEEVHWMGPQGTEIDGVITLPPFAGPGDKFPVALIIHGGPDTSSRLRFTVASQALAASGFIVFEPNYRGSDNLGKVFQAAIYQDAGEGPGEDIMSGLKKILSRPDVAPGKPFISGWSYGGFMTTWLLGRYPDQWKAAVAGAPVTNWQHQFDLSDGNIAWAKRLGVSPYIGDGADKLWRQSPASMQTMIKAPTLIMSDTEDYRVPFTQAFSLYRALEENGVETKFFVFPLRGHSPADPIRQSDTLQIWIDWLERHKH